MALIVKRKADTKGFGLRDGGGSTSNPIPHTFKDASWSRYSKTCDNGISTDDDSATTYTSYEYTNVVNICDTTAVGGLDLINVAITPGQTTFTAMSGSSVDAKWCNGVNFKVEPYD